MFFVKQKKAKDNLLQQKVTRQKTVTLYGLFSDGNEQILPGSACDRRWMNTVFLFEIFMAP